MKISKKKRKKKIKNGNKIFRVARIFLGRSADGKQIFFNLGPMEIIFFLEMNQSETRIACGGHVC